MMLSLKMVEMVDGGTSRGDYSITLLLSKFFWDPPSCLKFRGGLGGGPHDLF